MISRQTAPDSNDPAIGAGVSEEPAPPPAILGAVKAVLRPLVRLLIARGVTLPALRRALKEVYVESAAADFALADLPATDSRIAMLTGVHRKDVRDIRAAQERPADAAQPGAAPHAAGPRAAPLAASVIGRWLGDPAFAESGAPKVLPLAAAVGPSFQSLVESLSKDVRPRTVQAELERLDLVAVDRTSEPPSIRLLVEALVPPGDSDAAYDWLGANAGDHLRAAVANVLRESGAPTFLERAVFHGGLDAASVDALEEMARSAARDALSRLNAEAIARKRDLGSTAVGGGGSRGRFRFGVYFYREPTAAGGQSGAGEVAGAEPAPGARSDGRGGADADFGGDRDGESAS